MIRRLVGISTVGVFYGCLLGVAAVGAQEKAPAPQKIAVKAYRILDARPGLSSPLVSQGILRCNATQGHYVTLGHKRNTTRAGEDGPVSSPQGTSKPQSGVEAVGEGGAPGLRHKGIPQRAFSGSLRH
jgi:hypothetical protein